MIHERRRGMGGAGGVKRLQHVRLKFDKQPPPFGPPQKLAAATCEILFKAQLEACSFRDHFWHGPLVHSLVG